MVVLDTRRYLFIKRKSVGFVCKFEESSSHVQEKNLLKVISSYLLKDTYVWQMLRSFVAALSVPVSLRESRKGYQTLNPILCWFVGDF